MAEGWMERGRERLAAASAVFVERCAEKGRITIW
jgi:hypothetical protein